MSFQDLPDDVIHVLDPLLDLLSRQALAMTCAWTRKLLGRLSSRILSIMPESWSPWQFNSDPCAHYYYPILYRAVREAPDWLWSWTMGTSKTVYHNGRLGLKLIWYTPQKEGTQRTCWASFVLTNNQGHWKFSAKRLTLPLVCADVSQAVNYIK